MHLFTIKKDSTTKNIFNKEHNYFTHFLFLFIFYNNDKYTILYFMVYIIFNLFFMAILRAYHYIYVAKKLLRPGFKPLRSGRFSSYPATRKAESPQA